MPIETPKPAPKVEPAAPKVDPKEEPRIVEITEEVPKVDKGLKELSDKITILKERGATHFRKQQYKEAIKQFSEGINLFTTAGEPHTDTDLKTKITHLYTNRCLCFHNLDQ